MNILYIGSSGALSLVPFKKLQSSTHAISAVAVDNPITIDNKIIALENESLALAANQSGIPVIDLSRPLNDVIEQCSLYPFDVILISCYGRRLPGEIIELAVKGCYNMHPSLLPRFRGPEPVFWQMKLAAETGVSWHQVVHLFDAGDIVAQQRVVIDDGSDYFDISLQLAEHGAALMMGLLSELADGSPTLIPQDPEIASYYPYPEDEDFEITAGHTARQLYNFMHATASFGKPYVYRSGGLQFHLDEALDFDINLTLESAEIQGNRLFIPCDEGVLIATYTDKMPL
jgi:methionyl-tRNA formyltransferase